MSCKIYVIIGFAFATLLNTAFASQSKREYLTRDFFVETVESKVFHNLYSNGDFISSQTDCRAHIRTIMCLVDPTIQGQDSKKRVCQQGGENYAHFFETLYDLYPPALQRMFCSLDVIYIEKKSFGTAYANLLKDETGKILGAQMGIRKSVLDEGLNLTAWASWKEQLSFGGVTDSYGFSPDLPTIATLNNSNKLNDFLYFVVAHEFGHLFDFANEINKTKNCHEPTSDQELPECDLEENSWGEISWESTKRPKPKNDFLNRSLLCFYWCEGNPLDPTKIPQIYSDFSNTDFISIYATTQPWDDFADSLAYFLVNKNLKSTYVIQTNQGASYDIMEKLKSPVWNKKFQFLENFLKRTDIAYP